MRTRAVADAATDNDVVASIDGCLEGLRILASGGAASSGGGAARNLKMRACRRGLQMIRVFPDDLRI
eukprot:1006669-Alexandrium_andersonii.AAC.1